MLKTYNYQGPKDHMGASMILITKAFTKKIVCAAVRPGTRRRR